MKYIDLIYLVFFVILLNTFFFINYSKISELLNIYDLPDKKLKKHKNKAFPIGGVILFINLIFLLFIDIYNDQLKLFYLNNLQLIGFMISCTLIFIVGLFDDKINLNYLKKFFFLSLLLLILLQVDKTLQISELRIHILSKNFSIEFFKVLMTTFFILLFINAYNMFDGINLQAGLYSIIVLSLFCIKINSIFVFVTLIIFLFIFLLFNHKKNVFLGNSGSLLISFILSYYFILFYNLNSIEYAEIIYLFMCIPGLDMFRLFLERIFLKKNPFKGDSNHLHHILVRNLGFKSSTIIIQGLVIFTLIIGLYFSIKLAILFSLIIYFIIIFKYRDKKIDENN